MVKHLTVNTITGKVSLMTIFFPYRKDIRIFDDGMVKGVLLKVGRVDLDSLDHTIPLDLLDFTNLILEELLKIHIRIVKLKIDKIKYDRQ